MRFKAISDYVFMYLEEGQRQPTPDQLRLLGNLALDSIFIRDSSWSNSDDMTGLGSMTLPADCRNVTLVTFQGNELNRCSLYTMDNQFPGWRTCLGTPTAYFLDGTDILLNAKPVAGGIGSLQIFGGATLGHFSDDPLDVNPLDYLPLGEQMAPAYYILAELPFQSDAGLARSQRFAAKWQEALSNIHFAAAVKRSEPFNTNDME